MKTGLITHQDCLNHKTPPGHPEQIARLEYILEALQSVDLLRINAPLASHNDLLRVHLQSHIEHIIKSLPQSGYCSIDGDTHMSPGSYTAALRAVGGVLKAVDMVMAKSVQNAFVATRPPGHHAERNKAMGFCFFGNAAIGAKYALQNHGLERVAVVDFDVHHGNGTQDLLWDEKGSLFITSHQSPLWPGTGSLNETGAYENIVNIPLPPHSYGKDMRIAYETLAFPKLEAFEPELIVISAGFDAHFSDPLAELNWVEADFAWLTRRLMSVANSHAKGRLVSVLEGGYDLPALASSVKIHVETLSEIIK